jgi:hypothetical protein
MHHFGRFDDSALRPHPRYSGHGVGCVHAFVNAGGEPFRWLETFSPQPPAENVFRFIAEWEQRARELEGQ